MTDISERLRGLMEKATAGPWRVDAQRLTGKPEYAAEAEARNNAIWAGPDNHFLPVVGLCSLRPAEEGEPWVPMCAISADDATLIVEAVNSLPTLLARIDELEGALEPFNAAWREARAAADIAPMIETARRATTAKDFRRAYAAIRARAALAKDPKA